MVDTERYVPPTSGRIAYEHLHRYAVANDYVANARVLDIACGEGYGSNLLAATARHVVGVDKDAETIGAARLRYPCGDRLVFLQGDALELPVADSSFDVVVTFETLEHLQDAERFLAEIKRVLTPGGLLIVSTPNAPEYRKSSATRNPFHLQEYDRSSFDAILAKHFAHREMSGQRMLIASSLAPLTRTQIPNDPVYRAYLGDPGNLTRHAEVRPAIARLPEPEYFLCFCSDVEIVHPVAADSIYIAPNEDLWSEHRRILGWASGVHDDTEALRKQLGELEGMLAVVERTKDFQDEQSRLLDESWSAVAAERAALGRMLDASYATIEQQKVLCQSLMQRESEAIRRLDEAERQAEGRRAKHDTTLASELRVLTPLLARFTDDAGAPSLALLVDVLAKAWHERELAAAELGTVRGRFASQESELEQRAAALAELRERADEASDARERDRRSWLEQDAALQGRIAELEQRAAALAELRERADEASDAHARDRRSWLEQDAALQGRIAELEQQAATARRAELSACDRIDDLSAHITVLTEQAASVDAARVKQDDASRQLVEELHHRLAALDEESRRITVEARARENVLADHRGRLQDLQKQRESDRIASERLLQGLADRLSAGRLRLPAFEASPDRIGEGIDLLAYRGELERELLDAARAGRAAGFASPGRASLLPLESGEMLFEQLLFSDDHYLAGDPGFVGQAEPLQHYLDRGWIEGRSPNALFDGDWYFAKHPDAAASGLSPLSHYIRHGAAAGLQPHPCFDRAFYAARYPEALREAPDVFQYFLRRGLKAGHAPCARVEALAAGRSVVDVLSELLNTDLRDVTWSTGARAWPSPVNDAWLPQTLTDYISDEFGPSPMEGLFYLFSVITYFNDRPDAFATSRELQFLTQRARKFAHRSSKLKPDVSIIIPVHNNLVYTLTSILSILELKTCLTFEIIVGDDGSTDATADIVGSLGHPAILVRHAERLGFLQNCNACARQAEGRYLVFLNNDTIALPGWLDELIAPHASDRSIGLTGSKLINSDGTLQEAGGILWNDGSAWNYGRGDDPRLPHFSYSKDVDYCSGASIAISKILWDELGGFDATFSPAYCEDSDLAFRVRAAGCKTWFAAASILIHHEGRSHGRDVETGIKAYQVANQAKLLERWRSTLADEGLPNAKSVFLARDRSARKPHILIIDHYVPQWDCDAGSRTMLHFIKLFVRQGFQVTFWPDNLYRDRPYAKPLQDLGVEIIYGPQYVGGFEAWYSQVSEFVPYTLLSRPQIAEKYIDFIDRRRSKVLFYGHDLHWKRLEKQWLIDRSETVRTEMETMRELEERICGKSDVALYPSASEVETLQARMPGVKAASVPAWFFDDADFEAMRSRLARSLSRDHAHLMFVGGFQHTPNIDGLLWFATEVWPLIKAGCDAVQLTIAGSKPPPSITSLVATDRSITVAGHISDAALDRLYSRASLAIVPLRFGGGVKGKVIEAFSKAVPVVATMVGMQGIDDAETLCFTADDPKAFAESVLSCLNGSAHVQSKVEKAITFLENHYSLRSLAESLSPYVRGARSFEL